MRAEMRAPKARARTLGKTCGKVWRRAGRRVAKEGDGVGKDFFKGRRAVSMFVGRGTGLAEEGSPTGGPGRGQDAGATAAWGWPSEEVAGAKGARGSPVDGLSAQQEQDPVCAGWL